MTFKPTLYCSFCGKSQHDVEKLIAGPAPAFICDECVAICSNIITDSRAAAVAALREELGSLREAVESLKAMPPPTPPLGLRLRARAARWIGEHV